MGKKTVKVQEYTRDDGTKVPAHVRSVPHHVRLHSEDKQYDAVMPGSYVNDLMKSPTIDRVEVVKPITKEEHIGWWEQLWQDLFGSEKKG
jgi:hypothetical protein